MLTRCSIVPRPIRCPGLQVSVGDGTLEGTEQSVFEIGLSRAGAGGATVQLPTIVSVEPNQISSKGGEIVTISGTSFDDFPERPSIVYVQFGTSEPVIANIIGSSELVCTAPATAPEMFDLELVHGYFVLIRVTNLVNFWSNAIQLFVETQPQVSSTFPNAGPSCGGTRVTIAGRNFLPSVATTCMFGEGNSSVSVPAMWHNPSLVECITPPWPLPDGEEELVVPFALSSSKEEDRQSPLTFRFATPIVVATVWPEMGPAENGTNVTISGTNFNGYDLTCVIAGKRVAPVVQEDGHLQCTVPPRWWSPPHRTFKIKVVKTFASSDIYNAYEKFEVVDADVTTVGKTFEYAQQTPTGLEPDTIVLPLVRGHQYWLDQTDASNSGHPVVFSADRGGIHASGGKVWTEGVQRLSLLSEASAYGAADGNGTGAGVLSFQVPMDAPDVLHMCSETSHGLENDITAIITDHVVYTSIKVVATHGSACDSSLHPFRLVPRRLLLEVRYCGRESCMQTLS